MKANILGTDYKIYKNVSETSEPRLRNCYGFCDYCTKEIYISEDTIKEDIETMKNLKAFENKVLRHEIIHAFFFESGLRENSNKQIAWAENEEMIDWIAIQSPKIFKVFKSLNIL